MAKLNNRQKVILIVAAIAVLFGLYVLLSGPKNQKDRMKSSLPEQAPYISSISSELMKNTLNLTDTYIVAKAEADWVRNPFWEKGTYREWANKDNPKTADDPASKIVYSGYIDVGQKKMAVINGLEYSIGDMLDISDYVLKKITASKIVLYSKIKGGELEIPIQE